MSGITAHILDTSIGKPAAGVMVCLEAAAADGGFSRISEQRTDTDGRVSDLLGDTHLEAQTYRLMFLTGAYFAAQGRPSFYPHVEVQFNVLDPAQHYHIPLLLNPYGYSTYRGS